MPPKQRWSEEEFELAVAPLRELSICTGASPLKSSRAGVLVNIACPTGTNCDRRRNVQREFSKDVDTLPKVVASLVDLLRTNHGECIAEADAEKHRAAEAAKCAYAAMMGSQRRGGCGGEKGVLVIDLESALIKFILDRMTKFD